MRVKTISKNWIGTDGNTIPVGTVKIVPSRQGLAWIADGRAEEIIINNSITDPAPIDTDSLDFNHSNEYVHIKNLNGIKFKKIGEYSSDTTCYAIYLEDNPDFHFHIITDKHGQCILPREEHVLMDEICDQNFDLGRLYIDDSGYWTFEDRLVVERTTNDYFNESTFKKTRHGTSARTVETNYQLSYGFMPFVNLGWRITGQSNFGNVLTNGIKNRIIQHYINCNEVSVRYQQFINYNKEYHYNFSLIDHIMNASRFTEIPIYLDKSSDGGYVYAMNELINKRILRDEEYCDTTPIGNKTYEFGLREAENFNKYQERQALEEKMRIDTLNAAKKSIEVSQKSLDISRKMGWRNIWTAIGMGVLTSIVAIGIFFAGLYFSSHAEKIEKLEERIKDQELRLKRSQNIPPFKNP